MARYLMLSTGAGEYAGMSSFAKYVKSKGDTVIVMVSENVVPILRSEGLKDLDIEVFSINAGSDIYGRIKTECEFYDIDVLAMYPSRGILVGMPRPAGVKCAVSLESNLQFQGVGASYKLDHISPNWLDIYAVLWPQEIFERALYAHYGVSSLSAYKDMNRIVKAVGWIPYTKIEKKTQDYAFTYFGSGSNFNLGILQKLVDVYFEVDKTANMLSVTSDVLCGNYPRLDAYPAVRDYDNAMLNAKEVFLHEGFGSITKCVVNQVPVMSVCGPDKIKQLEVGPCADAGIIYKFDRPALPIDIDLAKLKEAIIEFKAKQDDIKKECAKYDVNGCENLYKLIQERL